MNSGQFKPNSIPCPCDVQGQCQKPFSGKPCRMWCCSGCGEYNPWCVGADDDTPDLCDACAMMSDDEESV